MQIGAHTPVNRHFWSLQHHSLSNSIDETRSKTTSPRGTKGGKLMKKETKQVREREKLSLSLMILHRPSNYAPSMRHQVTRFKSYRNQYEQNRIKKRADAGKRGEEKKRATRTEIGGGGGAEASGDATRRFFSNRRRRRAAAWSL